MEDLLEVLEELQDSAKDYKTFALWAEHIEDYQNELKEKAKNSQEEVESISLATMHSAKGLEYSVVYLIEVNEGIVPYKKAVLDPEVEEERRLFYVGMTRAKDALHLSAVKRLNGHEVQISPFIRDCKISVQIQQKYTQPD